MHERPDPGRPRGLLRPAPGPGEFHHARFGPVPALAGTIQHFWIVRWDLLGHPPQRRETLPHPNVQAVFDAEGAFVHGVHPGRFATTLAGRDGVFGVKFRAGGFRALLGRPVSSIRGKSLPLDTVVQGAGALHAELRALAPDDAAMVAAAERHFLARCPPQDAQALLAGRIVDAIAADPGIVRVEQACERHGLGLRALQRLFNDYVGIGPKWTIQRCRLHEAIERLDRGSPPRWAELALDLGYFDQAHFIRDFRAMTGRTPAGYAAAGSAGDTPAASASK
jgi:AraC-like DNA-binding protein